MCLRGLGLSTAMCVLGGQVKGERRVYMNLLLCVRGQGYIYYYMCVGGREKGGEERLYLLLCVCRGGEGKGERRGYTF